MSKYISKDLLVNKTYTAFDQQDLYLPTHFRDVIDEAEELTEEFEPSKSEVLKALKDVRAEIEKSIEESAKEAPISECGERYGFWKSIEIIDRKIAEVKGDKE